MKADSDERAAYTHMLWGAFAFAAMGAFGHAAGERCSWHFVPVARTVVAFVISFAVAKAAGVRLVFPGPRMLWLRSAGGSVGLVCNFYAITHLPVSDALTISNTIPIWVTLFGWLFFRERPNAGTWAAVLMGVAGIALVQQPHFAGNWFACLMALAGAFFTALGMLGLNRLGGIDPRAIVVHFSAASSLTTILFLLLTEARAEVGQVSGALTIVLLVMTGVSGVFGQWGVTLAFSRGHAARVSVVALTQILFALVFDLLIWRRSVNATTLIGMLLVIAPTAWLLARSPAKREIVEAEAETG
jgi:drug/metabolite transporter (DMT)-like permease